MQEPEQAMDVERSPKKKSMLMIGVAAASAVVLLAALFIAHSIFNNSYGTHLDRLKGMVAEETAKLEQGDPQADYAGQYRFYLAVDAQLANLSDILAKLNDKYPLLLTRASEKSLGLADLHGRMDGMMPGLQEFKAAADEDGAIAGELSAMLGKSVASEDYAGLLARNAAAAARIAGVSFTGSLEEDRAALAASLGKRAAALEFLVEDAGISEQFAAVLADVASSPDDLTAKLNDLIAENQQLSGRTAQADLPAHGAGGDSVVQAVAQRQTLLNADVAYLVEIKALMAEVAAFNGKLEQGLGQGTKFTERLAAWMVWVNDLNTLQAGLKAINDKPDYQGLEEGKRELASLGLSEMGLTLSGYAPALSAVNSAMSQSAAIEKEIDAVMKSKARMVDKVTTATHLLERNGALMSSIAVELPPELAEGLTNFSAGCTERNVFLTEYAGYVRDQDVAAGQKANRSYYLGKYEELRKIALTYPAGSDEHTFYQNLAKDQQQFASTALAEYNAALKSAQAHKKAYEASRKKYVPMLDKVD